MQDKKNIAIIISSLSMGGAERVASFLANHLPFNITLILWSDKNRFYAVSENVKVCVIGHKRGIFGGLGANFSKILALVRIFKEQKIDLAISCIHQTNILSILASKIAKIKVVATEHSIYESLEKQKAWFFLRKIIYPYTDCVTTLTSKDLKNYSFLQNVCVMPNPISVEKEELKDYSAYKPYILSAGRMIESKHFDELIEAFAKFSKTHQEYSLLLAGEGALKESLEQKAKELGAKVVFLGRQENLYSLYKQAEFFALSSHKEGLSNVLIEALMCGIPVVSYDCPYGPSEIIENGVNGLLVNLGEVDELSEAFCQMMMQKDNFKQQAPKIKERFSKEIVLEKWEKLISKIL
ncbi:glycosyltransferase family 4 protein [Helicobacter burdigaliensis]|uniref:glycosyltransferase family 4 protein n=1 Tax=Helicobacter burdigaliensis TaxID=2315334 RepID=UPI000EF6D9AD|nr:glycosyltransferase family 4 protein [Helicobacter burdigaliensis]